MTDRPGSEEPLSVLLVDDDDDLRFLATRWLRSSSRFRLIGECRDGAEAIDAALELQPDVVVMDVSMPEYSGQQAATIIRSRCPQSRMLAYTARSDRSSVLAMIGAGVDGYLVKSGREAEFLQALAVVADGGTYLSPTVTTTVFDHVRTSLEASPLVDAALRPGVMGIALQPIVDLGSGATAGYEALARFAGTDAPGPVFDNALRAGRGIELELAAVDVALTAASHVDVDFVSINVSPETASTHLFRDALGRAAPTHTVLELTEKAAINDYQVLRLVLDDLRSDGFRIALDDVGAGFSSLNHVHQLAPDLIKIDRYLIEHIDGDGVRQSMVGALIGIADRLGSRLVAEGIETEAELDTLVDLGVELGQGFLLGMPEMVIANDDVTGG